MGKVAAATETHQMCCVGAVRFAALYPPYTHDMDFDAMVIGGGPAGSIAALRLARLGWRVAIIERGARHREKTCGHCLNPRALRALADEGLLDCVRSISQGTTRALRVHVPQRRPLTSESIGSGILVDRRQFDQLLMDHAAAAGALIVQPASAAIGSLNGAASVAVSHDGYRRTLTCGVIIGADGLGSGVARSAGLSRAGRIGRKFGFAFDVPWNGATKLDANAIHMFVVDGGYVGIVREADGIHAAGLVGESAHRDPFAFARWAAQQHHELAAIGFADIDRDGARNFSAIGPMPWRPDPRRIANQWCALVGDAAGYVEPFTGEGMSWAIRSAQVLGDVLTNVPIGAWNQRLAQHYSKAWRYHVGRMQRWCSLVAFTLARPRISGLVHRAGLQWPALTRRIVEQVVAP